MSVEFMLPHSISEGQETCSLVRGLYSSEQHGIQYYGRGSGHVTVM